MKPVPSFRGNETRDGASVERITHGGCEQKSMDVSAGPDITTASGTGAPERRRAQPEGLRLLERQAYLRELAAMFSKVWTYPIGAVLVEAAPWTGRTAFLGAACQLAADAEFTVLRCRGRDNERGNPYALVRQLSLQCRLMWTAGMAPGEARASISRASGGVFEDVDNAGVPSTGAYDALGSALEQIASEGPLLIAVDDAHLADAESAEWLLHYSRRLVHRGLALVVTMAPRRRGQPLGPLDRIASEPTTRRIVLGPLSLGSVSQLVGACFGEPPCDEAAAKVHELTAGSPLLALALAEALARSRGDVNNLSLDQIAAACPTRVAQALLARLTALPMHGEMAHALLESIAVLEGEANLANCADLSGLDLGVVGALTDCLIDDGLLVEQNGLRFVQPLVRSVLLEEMSGPRRAKSHLAAAKLLEDCRAPMMVVVSHLLAAGEQTDPWAAACLEAAGRNALAKADLPTAAFLLKKAVRAHGGVAGPELSVDLARATATVDLEEAVAHVRRAMDLGGPPRVTAEVVQELLRARPDGSGSPTLTAILEDAANRLDLSDPDLRVELEVMLASIGGFATGMNERRATIERLIDLSLVPSTPSGRLGHALAALSASNNHARHNATETCELLTRALFPGELVAGDRWSIRLRV